MATAKRGIHCKAIIVCVIWLPGISKLVKKTISISLHYAANSMDLRPLYNLIDLVFN